MATTTTTQLRRSYSHEPQRVGKEPSYYVTMVIRYVLMTLDAHLPRAIHHGVARLLQEHVRSAGLAADLLADQWRLPELRRTSGTCCRTATVTPTSRAGS